jgi:hypothetical protein
MAIDPSSRLLVQLLSIIREVIWLGICVASIPYVEHSTRDILSIYTRVEKYDINRDKRRWERFFNTLISPIGESAADKIQYRSLGPIAYQLSIGGAVIFLSLVVYGLTAGMMIGSALAAYNTFGVTIDVLPLFQGVVAVVVVVAMAVMIHAGDRANYNSNP